MIINDFIHMHIPRTAGQKIRSLFQERQKCLNIHRDGAHIPIVRVLEIKSPLKIFIFVRNPWDFYISTYFFRLRRWAEVENPQGLAPVDAEMRSFSYWMKFLDQSRRSGVRMTRQDGTRIEDSTYGPISISDWRKHLLGEHKPDYIGYFENFEDDVRRILGQLIPEALKKYPLTNESLKSKVNNTRHDHYSCYYDREIVDLVYEWDGEFINEFNYKFEEKE